MKLSEMLALVGGPTFLDDRVSRLSGISDELFDDDTIISYLNEAQLRLCTEAWVLEDLTTAEVCQIQLEEGVTDYALHPSILGVKYVRLSDSEIDLLRVGYYDNRLHAAPAANDPKFWDVNAPATETPGRPSRWSTDMGTQMIRIRRKPDAAAAALQAQLAVVRTPLEDLAAETPDATPEVDKKYHLLMCKFAAGSCATGGDVDVALVNKGRGWLRDFEKGLENAKRYKRRLQYSMPQFRCGGWAADA